MRNGILLILGLAWTAAVSAQKVPAASAFGAREDIQDISLSPDAGRIAFVSPIKGEGNALFTADLNGDPTPKRVMAASGAPEKISYCDWVSNTRLACLIYIVRKEVVGVVGITRVVAVDHDGSNLKVLSTKQGADARGFAFSGGRIVDLLPGADGVVLLGRIYVPEDRIGSNIKKSEEGYGVDRLDTATLRSERVIKAVPNASEFISDGRGNVRIMGTVATSESGYDATETVYRYRRAGSTAWEPLSVVGLKSPGGFNPYAVDPAENVAYGFKNKDGRQALYKIALDGGLQETLVASRPDVDIDRLLQLGRQKRIVGYSFATDRRQAVYFDPALVKLKTSLAKVLPDASAIRFAGASADEQKLLIVGESDVNPGQYYLFDRKTRQLRPLISARPQLADYTLAPVKPIEVKVADGTLVPAYLTLPPGSNGKKLPSIVMPHGGPGARDEWGFDWLAQYYANRGFAVLQPNFRGSSGYGDGWFQDNGFKSWKVAIGDVTDSGKWLVSQGIADPAKLAIVGWSYGGYAALQSGTVTPDLFKAIVAIAPVTDLQMWKDELRNYSSYYIRKDFIGSGAHVIEGSPAQQAARLTAPVQMFHGDLDINVGVAHAKTMDNRLRQAGKSSELILYKGLDHQLDDSDARADMLAKSDGFLRRSLGIE